MNLDLYRQRLIFVFHVLIVGLVLAIITLSAWELTQVPTDGLIVSSETHIVSFVDPFSENAGKLHIGDIVEAINGVPLTDAEAAMEQYVSQLHQGNVFDFDVIRPGENEAQVTIRVPIVVGRPSWLMVFLLLGSIFTAVSFWLVGIPVLFFAPDERRGYIFFYFCQAWAAFLAAATLEQNALMQFMYVVLSWGLGAVTIHFHAHFPVPVARRRGWIAAGYTVAGVGMLLELMARLLPRFPQSNIVSGLRFAWLLLTLVLSLVFILRAYLLHRSTPYTRRQVGLITVGSLIAFLPLLVFSVLPELLQGYPVLPYPITIYFLAAIPFTYGYAALQFKFIRFERYASRSSTWLLTFTLTSGLYIIISTLLSQLVRTSASQLTPGSILLVMLPVFIFSPLYKRVRIYVDKLFYGGWYDYSTVVSEVSFRLESAAMADSPAQLFSETLQSVMQLKWVAVLLPDGKKKTLTAGYAGDLKDEGWVRGLTLEGDGAIVEFLHDSLQPQSKHAVETGIRYRAHTATEKSLLRHPQIRLFVPFLALSDEIGIFVLGPKFGDDIFDANDLRILDVVARQTSLAIQNAQLITRLREKAVESERYQREVIRAREEERKRISRELHDQLIQALVGLKYQIVGLKQYAGIEPDRKRINDNQHEQIAHLHDEIGNLIQTTRGICNDLRPPALDLGVIPSIRSLAVRFEQATGIIVHLRVDGDRRIIISEDVALCIFRCTNEALTNIAHHANANSVHVHINIEPERVLLSVADDGSGFVLPDRLGSLMEAQHFGLVGMRERVELLHGTFAIQSQPGQGTRIQATMRLP